MKTLELKSNGQTYTVQLQICSYCEGNLAIEILYLEDGAWEPWSNLTVNLQGTRQENCAFIDTNNNGQDILPWLLQYGLAIPVGNVAQSGYCRYPEYRFRPECLQEMDAAGYAQYLAHRRQKGQAAG